MIISKKNNQLFSCFDTDYRIAGNFRGRKFLRLTSIKTFRELNFEDFIVSYHVIQFKGICFMWFKVTIFYAEQHTLLIQSLQQGILCVFNFLAAVLLVSCGQTLVSCSQPLFSVDHAVHRNKGAGYVRPARPLFHEERYRFQYKLKAITPFGTEEPAKE